MFFCAYWKYVFFFFYVRAKAIIRILVSGCLLEIFHVLTIIQIRNVYFIFFNALRVSLLDIVRI